MSSADDERTPDARSVKAHMAAFLGLAPDRLEDGIRLEDVVTESFLLVSLVVELQEVFAARLSLDDLSGVVTVGDLVACCRARS